MARVLTDAERDANIAEMEKQANENFIRNEANLSNRGAEYMPSVTHEMEPITIQGEKSSKPKSAWLLLAVAAIVTTVVIIENKG